MPVFYLDTSAIMMVHSFSQSDEWFEDYTQFISLFGAKSAVNMVVPAGRVSDLDMYFCWVRGDKRYLQV